MQAFRWALFLAPLFLLACGDLPTAGRTASAHPLLSGECVRNSDGVYVCPPIVVGPECDPYHYDCGPGDCMESIGDDQTIQSCPPGGAPGGPGAPPPPGGGEGTLPPADPDSCDTDDTVLDDPAVQAGIADLWARSGVDRPQAQRLEHSAWIVRNADGSHSVVPITSYSIQEPCRINPSNMNAPPGAVAWVHTHPFTRGEIMQVCGALKIEISPGQWIDWIGVNGQPMYATYRNEPSSPDRSFMYAINDLRKRLGQNYLEAYVIDNEHIIRYGANGDKDKPFGRCGY